MTISSSILSCCCGDVESCSDLDFAALPATANIDLSWTVTYQTNYFRVAYVTTTYDVIPSTPDPGADPDNPYAFASCPDGYSLCECNQNGVVGCTSCWKRCMDHQWTLMATATATLTINASGTINKAGSTPTSDYRELYVGQIEFSYAYQSDYTGDCGNMSGTFTPFGPTIPDGGTSGLGVAIYCDARPDTWATGMCRPYWAGAPAADHSNSLIAEGPHLRLATRINAASLETYHPNESPNCTLGLGYQKWSPVMMGYPDETVSAGWQRLQPRNMLFVKTGSGVDGSYELARTARGAPIGFSRAGTEPWPQTRPEAGDCFSLPGQDSSCDISGIPAFGDACAMTLHAQPRQFNQCETCELIQRNAPPVPPFTTPGCPPPSYDGGPVPGSGQCCVVQGDADATNGAAPWDAAWSVGTQEDCYPLFAEEATTVATKGQEITDFSASVDFT